MQDIGHVNLHGTATRTNDLAEAAALHAVWGLHADSLPCVALKGAIGHQLGAAGAVELAATVGLSAPHLSRSFHTLTGMTLRAYRTRLRVLQSLEPVADGVDLSRVAHDLGFSSHSHFTFAFRRTFAAAPSGVRPALAGSRK